MQSNRLSGGATARAFASLVVFLLAVSSATASVTNRARLKEHILLGRPGAQFAVINRGCVTGYNYKKLSPAWVSYRLIPKYCTGAPLLKKQHHYPDASVLAAGLPAAMNKDFATDDYEKGDLFPHADARGRGIACEKEAYSLANAVPMKRHFKYGTWRQLEKNTRQWAKQYGELWVISGPIDVNPSNTIGRGVSVPEHCFKIVVRTNGGVVRAMAFAMPQNASTSVEKYIVTIDVIEKCTGLNFFHELPDPIEKKLESRRYRMWPITTTASATTEAGAAEKAAAVEVPKVEGPAGVSHTMIKEWKLDNAENGLGAYVLLEEDLEEADLMEFVKYLAGDHDPVSISIWTSMEAYNDRVGRTEAYKTDYLLIYVRNSTSQGFYQGADEVRWMQKKGKFSTKYGKRTPL